MSFDNKMLTGQTADRYFLLTSQTADQPE